LDLEIHYFTAMQFLLVDGISYDRS